MENPQVVSMEEPTSAGESRRHKVDSPVPGMIRLKAERIEEKLVLSGEGGAKVAFSLELSADHPHPLTVELADPRVTLILHGALPDAGPVD